MKTATELAEEIQEMVQYGASISDLTQVLSDWEAEVFEAGEQSVIAEDAGWE